MNDHLGKLYAAFDHLYRDIGSVCAGCADHDCEGYVWLLEEEATILYHHGIPIAEVNECLSFIHSFEEEDGHLLIDKPKPPCILRKNGLCFIYSVRPLVCRMYPVGFARHDGSLSLVLHKDCQFSRQLTGAEKASFFQNVMDILRSVPTGVIRQIVQTFENVDDISSFPSGPNSIDVIATVDEI